MVIPCWLHQVVNQSIVWGYMSRGPNRVPRGTMVTAPVRQTEYIPCMQSKLLPQDSFSTLTHHPQVSIWNRLPVSTNVISDVFIGANASTSMVHAYILCRGSFYGKKSLGMRLAGIKKFHALTHISGVPPLIHPWLICCLSQKTNFLLCTGRAKSSMFLGESRDYNWTNKQKRALILCVEVRLTLNLEILRLESTYYFHPLSFLHLLLPPSLHAPPPPSILFPSMLIVLLWHQMFGGAYPPKSQDSGKFDPNLKFSSSLTSQGFKFAHSLGACYLWGLIFGGSGILILSLEAVGAVWKLHMW